MAFFLKLLYMLGRRTSSTGFEKPPAVHKRNDGEHLGTGSDLEDGKEVG